MVAQNSNLDAIKNTAEAFDPNSGSLLERAIRSTVAAVRFVTADALHEYVRTLERHYEEAS